MTMLKGQADVSSQVAMPVSSTFAVSPVSGETVVWYYVTTGAFAAASGQAASTVVTAKLANSGVMNTMKSALGSYNDTSLVFAAATRAETLVSIPDEVFSKMVFMTPTEQVAEATKYLTTAGYYAIDHRRGQIWLKSKATVANDSITYSYLTPTVGGAGFFFRKSSNQTFAGSNTTVTTPIFRVTGAVRIMKLYAIVTTAIGSNHTAAYYRFNDQSAQVNITLNTGTTISSATVGSQLAKNGLATAAIILSNASAGRITEPTTLETVVKSEFELTAKNGANSDIEYIYTTTQTPTTGAVTHFVVYEALSADGNIVAI